MDYRFTSGLAASNTYLTTNNGESQLTFDWTYDSVYFKFYNERWITINLTSFDGQDLIDTKEKKFIFDNLVVETLNRTKNMDWVIIKQAKKNLFKLINKLIEKK